MRGMRGQYRVGPPWWASMNLGSFNQGSSLACRMDHEPLKIIIGPLSSGGIGHSLSVYNLLLMHKIAEMTHILKKRGF